NGQCHQTVASARIARPPTPPRWPNRPGRRPRKSLPPFARCGSTAWEERHRWGVVLWLTCLSKTLLLLFVIATRRPPARRPSAHGRSNHSGYRNPDLVCGYTDDDGLVIPRAFCPASAPRKGGNRLTCSLTPTAIAPRQPPDAPRGRPAGFALWIR